jgi:hypothetical protein
MAGSRTKAPTPSRARAPNETLTRTVNNGYGRALSILEVVFSQKNPHMNPITSVGSATFDSSRGDTLAAGQELDTDHYLLSADARFALMLLSDGNLILWNNGNVVWQSFTRGSGATHLNMQTDGNLVLYTASNTAGTGGSAHLVVQKDGNLVTYEDSGSASNWQSGAGGTPADNAYGSDTLTATPHELDASSQDYLLSAHKRYALLMQSDGDLVLYGPGYHVLWNKNLGATKLVMQSDGNLVLYNGSTALWQIATNGTGTNRVVVQNDGNLVTYTAGNSPTWWTGTSGP